MNLLTQSFHLDLKIYRYFFQLGKTKTPEYNEVNLQIRGFDFVVLERFQKMIHQLAEVLGLDVANAWAVPAQHLQVKRFREGSAVTEMEVELRKYERVVQVVDAKSYQIPLLVDAVTTACPAGVTLQVVHHTPEHEDIRYVPDLELLQLRETLAAIGGPRKK